MRRYPLRAEDQIYFLHIPKTGGMSLSNTIYEYFPGDDRPQYKPIDLLNPPAALRKQRFIIGHTYFTMRHFLDREPIYITMLREPVSQVVSLFRHIHRLPEHPLHEKFRDSTLLEFLNTPFGEQMSSNYQTMSLAMDDDPRQFVKEIPAERKDQQIQINKAMRDAVLSRNDDKSLLELVKNRLQTFAFVGITSRMSDSIALLTYTFHWEPFPRILHFNFDPHRPTEIPQEARDLIVQRSPLDFELYEFGCELFELRRRDMILDLLETDHTFRAPEMSEQNRSYSASMVDLPPESVAHMQDNRGWSDGWAGPRWVLPGLAIPSAMKRLEIGGKTFPQQFKKPLKLTVIVGGKPVQQVEAKRDGKFSLSVPLTGGPVEILADQYFIPSQLGNSEDHRPLSWLIEAMNLKV